MGDERAIAPLIEVLGDDDPEDDECRVNRHAATALIEFGSAAVPPLIAVLQDPAEDAWRRYWAAKTLGAIGDDRAMDALIRALQDDEPSVYEGAAEALRDWGRDERALEPLRRKLATLTPEDPGYYTLRDAIEAIQKRLTEEKKER